MMARSYWHSSHYLEWLLDRQDVVVHRVGDLKILGSEEEYQKVMIFFTDVIQAFGKSIEVRQQVIATAIVYFKRFYSRNSFKTIDPWLMAPSCLFLASKVEEFGVVSQKNLMASCRNVVHNHYLAYFSEGGYGYPYRAQDVLECEFILLEAMDCSLIIFHPYRPLVQFCDELRPQLREYADVVLERSWWIVNDSFRTDVCLYYPPFIIALGCLQLSIVLLANNPDLLHSSSNANSIVSSTNTATINGTNMSSSSSSSTSTTATTTSVGMTTSSNVSSKLPGYLSNQTHHPNVNLLLVADQWFSELNVDMEKILEVTRHLLNLYDLWRRFDEATEMPNLLLKKLPRPVVVTAVVQPPQNYGATTTTTSGSSTTTGQSSVSLSASTVAAGVQQQPPHNTGTITSTASMLATTSGSSVMGIGSGIPTAGSIHNIPDPHTQQQQQQQRTVSASNHSRLHTQGMQHMGMR